MVALVLMVDLVAIALYRVAHLERAVSGIKLGFTIVWTIVTLAVVLTGVRRIRLARRVGVRTAADGSAAGLGRPSE